MRIGADGYYMRFLRTGLGRYQDGLLHALAKRVEADDRLTVYYNSRRAAALFDPPVEERYIRMPRPLAWNQLGLPAALQRDGCDVYLASANVLPVIGREPKLLVVHDCMAFADPSSKPGRTGRYLRRWMRMSARRAARVVSNSRWTAEQCGVYLDIDPQSVTVLYPGVDPGFAPEPESEDEERELRRRHGLEGDFVLHIGAFESHKGGSVLTRAVEVLRSRGHHVTLVRCGGPGPDVGGRDVMDLGFVEDADLRRLYRQAAVVCVPSRFEGFGLPVLEAMASGAPVVASRAGALEEAGGDVAAYVSPGDVDGLAEVMATLLSNPEERRRLGAAGIRRARSFSWDVTADGMYKALAGVTA